MPFIEFDVNAQDNAGRTPAHWCIIIQNSYLLRVLLLNGADHSIQDAEGQTALHLTIRLSFKDGIIAIGKSCPQAVCYFNYLGFSPIRYFGWMTISINQPLNILLLRVSPISIIKYLYLGWMKVLYGIKYY